MIKIATPITRKEKDLEPLIRETRSVTVKIAAQLSVCCAAEAGDVAQMLESALQQINAASAQIMPRKYLSPRKMNADTRYFCRKMYNPESNEAIKTEEKNSAFHGNPVTDPGMGSGSSGEINTKPAASATAAGKVAERRSCV
jgi:hypothetical protein